MMTTQIWIYSQEIIILLTSKLFLRRRLLGDTCAVSTRLRRCGCAAPAPGPNSPRSSATRIINLASSRVISCGQPTVVQGLHLQNIQEQQRPRQTCSISNQTMSLKNRSYNRSRYSITLLEILKYVFVIMQQLPLRTDVETATEKDN